MAATGCVLATVGAARAQASALVDTGTLNQPWVPVVALMSHITSTSFLCQLLLQVSLFLLRRGFVANLISLFHLMNLGKFGKKRGS